MLATYLVRGAKAGLVAGVVFGVFLAVVVTPVIGVAESLEHHGEEHGTGADAAGHAPAVPAVVGAVTSVLAGVAWGVLLGVVVFGGVFYLVEPTLPGGDAVRRAVTAGAGFLTVSGAPWLVLPPLAPGVERVVTVPVALRWYAGAMVVGGVLSVAAWLVYGRVRAASGRVAGWVAALAVLTPLAALPVFSPASLGVVVATPTAAAMAGVTVFGQLAVWATMAVTHVRFSRHATDVSTDLVADGTAASAD